MSERVAPAVNVLSLCSGVGWLDLGLHAGLDFLGIRGRVVGYCEREAYAASVLLARMEDKSLEPAPIWCGDLAHLPREPFRGQVDCITAGFPCQPHSVAGKRWGLEDERWIWPAIAAIVRDVAPWLVFLENVPGLVGTGGLAAVLGDLAEMGFDAEWGCISAASVGASHRRERIFIVAYRESGGFRVERDTALAGSGGHADCDGKSVENAGCPIGGRCREPTGEHRCGAPNDDSGTGGELANASGEGPQGGASARQSGQGNGHAGRGGGIPIFAPGPTDGRWPAILRDFPHLSPAVAPESGFRVLADGQPVVVDEGRADQLRCAGNGVVPLQAAAAFVELVRRIAA